MATTTNYSWTTPDDTALVKDGAAAIRSLGTAIDSTVFTNAGAAIAKATVDAKGDLIVGTADNTIARLASSGVNGEVLQVDTSTATGLKYGAIGANANWSLLNAGGTALTGAATITVSGISAKDKIMILVDSASSASASSVITLRFNADDASNYRFFGSVAKIGSGYGANNYTGITSSSVFGGPTPTQQTAINLGKMSGVAASAVCGYLQMSGANASGQKIFTLHGSGTYSEDVNHQAYWLGGFYDSASTISSVSILSSVGNFDAGTIFVYTSA
jgi:hypothetical protein